MAPSPRLVAFLGELDAALPGQKARAEALILRVPGEGKPALRADEEAGVLLHVADGIIPPVQAWVRAVKELAEAEQAWGPREHAAQAGRRFAAATQEFLDVWERLLDVQPATEPMRHVLGLVHQGCYEFFLSGPLDLWQACRAIAAGEREARLTFEPSAPSLNDASQELRRLRHPRDRAA
jgi:hypothetical protein